MYTAISVIQTNEHHIFQLQMSPQTISVMSVLSHIEHWASVNNLKLNCANSLKGTYFLCMT